jgi:hypothetical protein
MLVNVVQQSFSVLDDIVNIFGTLSSTFGETMNNGNGKQHARLFAEDITSMLDADLSRCAMTIYLALRIRSAPGGDFWTDHGTLAEMFATTKNRFHPKSVSRAIAELCGAGLIKREGKTNRTRYLVINSGIYQEYATNKGQS